MVIRPPLPLAVEIAPGADLTASPDLYEWTRIAGEGRRRMREALELSYGRDDEAAVVEAGTGSITFDDRDGDMSPRNPYGEFFGELTNGTPVRFVMRYAEDEFDRVSAAGLGTATSGQVWTNVSTAWSANAGVGRTTLAAGTASYAILQDVTGQHMRVRMRIATDTTPVSGTFVFAVGLRLVDNNNGYYAYFEFRDTGVISVKLVRRDAGVSSTLGEVFTAVTVSPGTYREAEVEIEGTRFRARLWPVGDPVPAWTVTAGAARIDGSIFNLHSWRIFTGGPATASVLFQDLTVDALIFAGDLAELPVDWDKSGEDSTTPAAIAGPLRRLLQGEDAVESPLRRQLTGYAPAGYWPMEDPSGSTTASPVTAGGREGVTHQVTFGETDAPAGAASSAKLDTAESFVYLRTLTDTGQNWAGMILLKLPADPPGDVQIMEWRSPTGTISRWTCTTDGGSLKLHGFNSSGDLVFTNGPVLISIDETQWFALQLEVIQVGGNIEYDMIWSQVTAVDAPFYAISGSLAGTNRQLQAMYLYGTADLVDMRFCHAWIGASTLPFVTSDFRAVATGYATEQAADRIGRLFQEAGIPIGIPAGQSPEMGPQRSATLIDLIRECVAVDMGVLMEEGYGFRYEPRETRYNLTPRMTLDWSAGDLAEAPKPTDDDQRLRNRYTVRRVNGGERTSEDTVSMARKGLRPGSPGSDLNLYDDSTLDDQASWRRALTAWDQPRWPRITIDLVSNPHLIPAWLSCRIGSRIRVVNPKAQMIGQWIDLIIEGAQQRIGRHEWKVTMACSPALPWDVALYDDLSKRKDSPSTTLTTAVDADDTVWVTSTDTRDDCWSTTTTGYVWELDGEEVTVTGMTGPASVATIAGSFEHGVSGWTPVGGTFVQSSAQALVGTYSGLLTTTGSPVQTYVRPTVGAPVVVGRSYTASCSARCSVSRNVDIAIDWLTALGAYISTSGATFALTAGVWTDLTVTATAPATAAFAVYGPTMASSPANGTQLHVEKVDLVDAANLAGVGPYRQVAQVTRATNDVAVPHDAGAPVHMAPRMLARYAL